MVIRPSDKLGVMTDSGEVTRILRALNEDPARTADELLPLVYDQLRRLAAARLRNDPAGQSLQATGLVHEAYLRLVDVEQQQEWHSRAHFFAAAAEAMRRILVEHARKKKRLKRGGDRRRVQLPDVPELLAVPPDEVLAVDEALTRLAEEDEMAAQLVKLRYFVGYSVEEAAEVLGISRATAYRVWKYAKAWLHCELSR